jgi:hypothetical protein
MHSSEIFFYNGWAHMTRFSASICILPSRTPTLTYSSTPGCLSFLPTRCLSPPLFLNESTSKNKKFSAYNLFFFVLLSRLNKLADSLPTFTANFTIESSSMSLGRFLSAHPSSFLNSHLSFLFRFTQTISPPAT